MDASTSQLFYLQLKNNKEEEEGRLLRARIPGILLWKSFRKACMNMTSTMAMINRHVNVGGGKELAKKLQATGDCSELESLLLLDMSSLIGCTIQSGQPRNHTQT